MGRSKSEMIDQLEIDLLIRRMERLDNRESGPSPEWYQEKRKFSDSWSQLAKDALKELEKYHE